MNVYPAFGARRFEHCSEASQENRATYFNSLCRSACVQVCDKGKPPVRPARDKKRYRQLKRISLLSRLRHGVKGNLVFVG